MSWLNRLFGRSPDAARSNELVVEGTVSSLAALYDDPEVKSERGLSVTGPRAEEVRDLGRRLFKSGGKASMLAARDALRERHGAHCSRMHGSWRRRSSR